jgi:cytochrome b
MTTTAHTATGPASNSRPASETTLVWDLPTRVFHWLLAASFIGAFATGDSERWQALHVLSGYTAGGLIGFRLLWGVFGTRYARFSGFSFAPAAVLGYLRSLATGQPRHYVGHNPAGSWAVLAMLAAIALTALTGWAAFSEIGPKWLEDVHETIANATVALIAVHVIAVIASSWLHRENLVGAMVSGFKRASGAVPAAGKRSVVAAALLATVAAFWGGWIPAPGLERGTGLAALQTTASAAHVRADRHHDRDKNDD